MLSQILLLRMQYNLDSSSLKYYPLKKKYFTRVISCKRYILIKYRINKNTYASNFNVTCKLFQHPSLNYNVQVAAQLHKFIVYILFQF